MKDFFISIFGKPEGIILFQLIEASQFTFYLSLIAFIGGAFGGAIITTLRILPNNLVQKSATTFVWLFQSTTLPVSYTHLTLPTKRIV